MKILPRLFVLWARTDRWHVALALCALVWFLVAMWCAHEARYQNRLLRVHMFQFHVLPHKP